MRCWSCQGEIADGSRFCGLCGSKQDRPQPSQTLAGAGARAKRSAMRTLVSGPGPAREEIVSSGGHRFAALSAGPAPAAAPEVTETLSEGVPAGALAGLLSARRTPSAGGVAAPQATLFGQAPRQHPAALETQPLASTTPTIEATQPDRPAASVPPAAVDATDREQPAVAPVTDDRLSTAPDRPASRPVAPAPPAKLAREFTAAPAVTVVPRSSAHLDPQANMPSVIVDSQLDREAAEVVRRAQDACADAAPPEDPVPDAARRKSGFRETAWFADALDPEALARAQDEDPQARQARLEGGDARLDSGAQRRFSLRTQDALPAQSTTRPARTLDAESAPPARGDRAALAGLIGVIVIALGVAGWFLFGR